MFMANSNSDFDNDTYAPASPLVNNSNSDSVSQFLSIEPYCAPSSSVPSSVVNVVTQAIEPVIEQDLNNDAGMLDQIMVPDVEPECIVDHSDSCNGANQISPIVISQVAEDTVHPSGRPKRRIVKNSRPLDEQFLYYD